MEDNSQICPCGSDQAYADCCQRYHKGCVPAKTAEALMRSRYCAYVIGDVDYLVKTTLPAKRSPDLHAAYQSTHDSIRWIGLDVVGTWQGTETDKVGKVEFRAGYQQGNKKQVHHEVSRFRKHGGLWYYVDGEIEDLPR